MATGNAGTNAGTGISLLGFGSLSLYNMRSNTLAGADTYAAAKG